MNEFKAIDNEESPSTRFKEKFTILAFSREIDTYVLTHEVFQVVL